MSGMNKREDILDVTTPEQCRQYPFDTDVEEFFPRTLQVEEETRRIHMGSKRALMLSKREKIEERGPGPVHTPQRSAPLYRLNSAAL